MKKLLAFVLCVVLTLSLCACNLSSVVDSVIDDVTENSNPIVRGVITDNVYASTFTGLTFTKPESWVFATDEEIASALGLASSMFNADFAEIAESSGSLYDMMVSDSLTGTNINLGYENLALSNSTNVTEEQYIEALEQQLKGVSSMVVEFEDEITTVKLSGQDYVRVVANVTASGIEMSQVYYLRKIDKFMNFVIVTLVSGYEISDIEAMFSTIYQ